MFWLYYLINIIDSVVPHQIGFFLFMTYSVIMNLKLLPISTTILFWVCICCYKTSSMANSTTGCEPKSCGNLTNISYPFWLSGHQPSFCGDLAFELNCSNNAPILVNSYAGMLQVLAINYENNSFQVLNPLVHGFCPILAYNLFLNPTKYFKVSEENRELFFLHNCKVPPSNYSERMNCTPGGTFAYLGGHYGNSSLPASSSGCNVTTDGMARCGWLLQVQSKWWDMWIQRA